MKKNLIKVTIILTMLLSTLIPLSVSAATSGTCGDNLTWILNQTSEILTISGTGYMDSWWSDYEVPWFTGRNLIKKIIIEDGVTSIGRNAFIECNNLENIKIPQSVKKIGGYAFYNTSKLKTITIPKSITSIDSHAFNGPLKTLFFEGTRSEWNKIIKYSNAISSSTVIQCATSFITYDANGGINAPNAIEEEIEKTIRISSEIPSREGYKFLGWSVSSSAIIAEYQPNDTITMETNDITLYAVWKLIPSTKTQSINGIFLVTPTGVENGNRIIFACYNDDRMVYVNPYIYAGETTIPFSTTETYDKVKVMVWENLETCVPLCEAEDVPLN